MNRKIRVWNETHKKMFYPETETNDHIRIDLKGDIYFNNDVGIQPYENCICKMQEAIGLKDKNGRDIFVNDLLRCKYKIGGGK